METYSIYILPEHIWKHVSPSAATTSYGNKPPIIGSGPFETVAFVKGSYIRMVRNPYWWGQKPAIDEIYFEAYQNADTMVNDLTKGRIDGAWGIPVAEFKQLQSVKGIKAIRLPLVQLGLPGVQLLRQGKLAGKPRAARLALSQRLELRDRQTAPLRPRLRRSFSADHQHHSSQCVDQSRLPLDAAGRPGLHLRPGQGQPAAHRRGLPAQERCALEQAGQADRVASRGNHRPTGVSDRGQADRRLAAAARPDDQALGDRFRHPHQRHLQLSRKHARTELRHGRLGVDRLLRPRSDTERPHHAGDRQPRRALLVERCSTTSWRSSRRAPSIRRSVRRSSGRCNRSCTSSRPGSR